MNEKKILVVDDETDIREVVKDILEAKGFTVAAAENADEAFKALKDAKPALIILDLNLPDIGGIEFCEKMLKKDKDLSSIPVIMLTVESSESFKVAGLEVGADDYVTKPFNARELVARVNAVLRRAEGGGKAKRVSADTDKVIKSGNLKLEREKYSVYLKDRQIELKPKEFDVLWLLVSKKGRVVSREMIMDEVWGIDDFTESRTLDKHIKEIRRKLGTYGDKIITYRNMGYKFES